MPNLHEASFRYATLRGKGNDFAFVRAIQGDILDIRSMLVRQESEKIGQYPPASIVTIGCLNMTLVDSWECCELESGCSINKSVGVFPQMIYGKNMFPVVAMTSLDGREHYTYISPQRVGNTSGIFGTKGTMWTFFNNHIYILNDRIIEATKVAFVPVDPRQVHDIDGCSNIISNCITPEKDVMIESHYFSIISNMLDKSYNRQSTSNEVEFIPTQG